MAQWVLALGVCLLAAASWAAADECPKGQTWNACGSACPQTCENPEPMFCKMVCVSQCECPSGLVKHGDDCIDLNDCPTKDDDDDTSAQNPCATALCDAGTHCETREVQCFVAPCNPVAECVPDQKEEDEDEDEEEKSCTVNNVVYRHGESFKADCNTCSCRNGLVACTMMMCQSPPSPCATVRCAAGTHCEVQEVTCIQAPCDPVAQCVPDQKDDDDDKAEEEEEEKSCTVNNVVYRHGESFKADCNTCSCRNGLVACTKMMCQNPPSPCATVRCAAGTHCEVQEVMCIQDPCDPIAQCVPDEKPDDEATPEPACSNGMTWNSCGSACPLTCDNPEPMACIDVCVSQCECPRGLVKHGDACVALSACPRPTAAPGDRDACATVQCAAGTHCEVQEVMCIQAPCAPMVQCVRDALSEASSCAAVLCPHGHECREVAEACNSVNCPKTATCVPVDVAPECPVPPESEPGQRRVVRNPLSDARDGPCPQYTLIPDDTDHSRSCGRIMCAIMAPTCQDDEVLIQFDPTGFIPLCCARYACVPRDGGRAGGYLDEPWAATLMAQEWGGEQEGGVTTGANTDDGSNTSRGLSVGAQAAIGAGVAVAAVAVVLIIMAVRSKNRKAGEALLEETPTDAVSLEDEI